MSSKKRHSPQVRQVPAEQHPNSIKATAFSAEQRFSGPLPPPQMLIKYNEAFPGCAERIVAMAERQAVHRQDIEKRVVRSNSIREQVGQVFGLLVALTAILSGVYLIMHNKPAEGIASILGPLAALASVFVYGKYLQKKELERKKF